MKQRVLIHICELNRHILIDAYSVCCQTNIINLVFDYLDCYTGRFVSGWKVPLTSSVGHNVAYKDGSANWRSKK